MVVNLINKIKEFIIVVSRKISDAIKSIVVK